jgi:hypothetical protein
MTKRGGGKSWADNGLPARVVRAGSAYQGARDYRLEHPKGGLGYLDENARRRVAEILAEHPMERDF